MSSIFVQISSFNDPELYKTIEDCINKTSKKNEVFFGLHECYIDNKTELPFNNISIKYSKAPENLGIGCGRNIANKFYNGEDYYLQVDAHSRFFQDWDLLLINDLEKYKSVGMDCVLTTYPMRYWYEDGVEQRESGNSVTSIKIVKNKEEFTSKRMLVQEAFWETRSRCSESTSGGFVFGSGEISKIEHHPGIFFGEEALRAACFYTNGYNLMLPEKNVIYHLYGSDTDRKPAWDLYPEEFKKGMEFTAYVMKSILSENRVNSISLGDKRPLSEYGSYIGVNFKAGLFV